MRSVRSGSWGRGGACEKCLCMCAFMDHSADNARVQGGEAQEKGLQVGDEVLLVDGRSVANLSPGEVVAVIVGPVGTDVSVLVK